MFTTLQFVEVPRHNNAGNSTVVEFVQANSRLYVIAPYDRPFVRESTGIQNTLTHFAYMN